MGSYYRHHNPNAGDGPEPFIGYVRWFTVQNPDLGLPSPRRWRRCRGILCCAWTATVGLRSRRIGCRFGEVESK
jgi:hypothetical protein